MKLLGSVQKFFYRDLAGIRATAPGFREVAIEPQVVGDLAWAQARVRTIRGEIAVHWRRRDNAFELNLTIPGNVTAHLTLPKLGMTQVRLTEGGVPAWNTGRQAALLPGIDNVTEDVDAITLRAGSGNYHFRLSAR